MYSKQNKASLIIISGPSGAGKSTVVDRLCENGETLIRSISATTRQPRSDEIDGIHYHFLTRPEFEKTIAQNGLLEWTEYRKNYYGTLRSKIEKTIELGKNVVLEIDVDGAAQLRNSEFPTLAIFLLPPSVESLRNRLKERNTEDRSEILKRLAHAKFEIRQMINYDYYVINKNDKIGKTVEAIKSIISSEQHRIEPEIAKNLIAKFETTIQ